MSLPNYMSIGFSNNSISKGSGSREVGFRASIWTVSGGYNSRQAVCQRQHVAGCRFRAASFVVLIL